VSIVKYPSHDFFTLRTYSISGANEETIDRSSDRMDFLVLGGGWAACDILTWFVMQASVWHAINDHRSDRERAVLEFMGLQVEASQFREPCSKG
jgi:hypothetical protein